MSAAAPILGALPAPLIPTVPPLELLPPESNASAACYPLPLPILRRILRSAERRGDRRAVFAVHAVAVKSRCFTSDTPLCNALLSAYLALSLLPPSVALFRQIAAPDVASYSLLISGHAKLARFPVPDALRLFNSMRIACVAPNDYAIVALLTACSRSHQGLLGRQVHALALKCCGSSLSLHVANALLGVYVKCEWLSDAVKLFSEMAERDVSSWNSLLYGLVTDGRYNEAAALFLQMQKRGIKADGFTLSMLFKVATEWCGLDEGAAVHALAVKSGLELDLSVGNALVGFYSEHGDSIDGAADVFTRMPVKDVVSCTGMLTAFMSYGMVESAVALFDQMQERNVITYNALLSGFCHNKDGVQALKLFRQMLEEGMEVSDSTVTAAVNSCALVAGRKESEVLHAFVIKSGCQPNAWIDAALIDMCTKCGRSDDAHRIFQHWVHKKSSAALNSLLLADSRDGEYEAALRLFVIMFKNDGATLIDEFMAATVLGLCGALGFLDMGRQMHGFTVKSALSTDTAVGNAAVSMYGKCGDLDGSVLMFDQMACRDIVSWNALITVHLFHRHGDTVLDLWDQMRALALKPDSITFVLIISACRYTSSDSVDACQELFSSMSSSHGITSTLEHYTAMVDALSYWGHFDKAEQLIRSMPFEPSASVWRALLDNCRRRSNWSLGREAMHRLLALEPRDPPSYALASNLYSATGRWHLADSVRQEMNRSGLRKIPARSWTVHGSSVHSFFARDRSHPRSKDVYAALEVLIRECIRVGYEPDTSYVLQEAEECQKKGFLYYHSAKLAVAHGVLTAEPRRVVRVMKNVRVCGDCHAFMKRVSAVTGREMLVRDPGGFHRFVGGHCCCGE